MALKTYPYNESVFDVEHATLEEAEYDPTRDIPKLLLQRKGDRLNNVLKVGLSISCLAFVIIAGTVAYSWNRHDTCVPSEQPVVVSEQPTPVPNRRPPVNVPRPPRSRIPASV